MWGWLLSTLSAGTTNKVPDSKSLVGQGPSAGPCSSCLACRTYQAARPSLLSDTLSMRGGTPRATGGGSAMTPLFMLLTTPFTCSGMSRAIGSAMVASRRRVVSGWSATVNGWKSHVGGPLWLST